MTLHAVILAGGELGSVTVNDVSPPDLVVAADSGLRHAATLGLSVDVLIGDFDSVDAEQLDRVREGGTVVIEHPTDKDATDLELAMEYAITRGVTALTVVGGSGGRSDHWFGNIAVLSAPAYRDVRIVALFGDTRITVITDTVDLHGSVGSIVSLFAVNGDVQGISTTGLQWELQNETLATASSRGISNVMTQGDVTVSLASGVCLALQPG